MLSSASDKTKLFAKNFSKNSNLDDLGISLPVFLSRTSLKLHITSVTPKMVITNLDSSKASGPECVPVVLLKNCGPELSYIPAELFNMSLKESFQMVGRSHWWSQYLRKFGKVYFVDLNTGKTQLVSFDQSIKMLVLTFSSELDLVSYIISIAKSACKKIRALIRSMKFLSPETALYLYKSTIQPYMEYCCHVWAGALSCFVEFFDKRTCKIVGPSLAASLEPLAHRQNIARLSLFYRHYFGRCSSELAELVPLSYSRGRSTRYSDRCMIFLLPFLDVTRMSMSTVSFLA